ncbi:MAG TPA: 2,3-bisphosphoglycerate-independent phosphoglycerate mutase [Bdellovibrionota bacterium]|nr:2,3-bisphosphoglycerate-independent phosphoglycerate mutase [Bdellovibrionota bacterium]
MSNPTHPAILIVIDGLALNPNDKGNAVKKAKMPVFQRLWETYPHTTLDATGLAVGLPPGQMGNSEVGHMNLGAGRVVFQDLTRIDQAIEDKSFFKNPVLLDACRIVKEKNSRLHLFGLVSDGGVHSQLSHILASIQLAKKEGVKELFLHACLDGRDTPPKSAETYIKKVERTMSEEGIGSIATIMGRFYGMDRDKRWDRTALAYRALVYGEGLRPGTATHVLKAAYNRNETDEFVLPTVINPNGVIKDQDVLFFFNFRADRMRQMVLAMTDDSFNYFERPNRPKLSYVASMTSYHDDYTLPVAFPPVKLDQILGEVISAQGWSQLRIAETEKYAHVTFFFNGGNDQASKGEDWVLIPSPKDIKTYDLKPEMSARPLTEELIKRMRSKKYQFVLINFANPDMVGHSGNFPAVVKALEVVDECLGKIIDVIEKGRWIALITADHGNSDQLIDYETGGPLTSHTTHPVPFIVIDPEKRIKQLQNGRLCDVAPTILDLMDVKKPSSMTGGSLIQ